jgi:hypothetical protein
MRLIPFALLLGFALNGFATIPAIAQTVESKVASVTLYRSQALVTRKVKVTGAQGAREIVVEGLPPQVVPGSLFAEGSSNVEVRAVRFRTRAVGETPREDIRKIELELKELRQKLAINQKQVEVAAKKVQFIESLKAFVAPTAQVEITRGVLNAETLEKLSQFAFDSLAAFGAEENKLAFEQADLNQQIQHTEQKLAELTNGSTKQVFDAVIFADKMGDAEIDISLSYMVNQCGWSPAYTFRASTEKKEVLAEYSALVQQMTGEDWNNVSITLSTASPGLSAAVPGLAPYHVTLSASAPAQQAQAGAMGGMGSGGLDGLQSQIRDLRTKQNIALDNYRNTLDLKGNNDFNWQINMAANEAQNLELVCTPEQLAALMTEEQENANIAYDLPTTVSLASRNDQQMVRILRSPLKNEFYHVAIPVLSRQVYREAELTNSSAHDLLAGPVTVYLDGRFVGKTEVPTVARGQTFVVGFGADMQMRTRRELVERKENVQGGNREVHFAYRLTVDNYKDAEEKVRVLDRLPYSRDSMSVRVETDNLKDPLSEDAVYVRTEKPKGILRWDVNVAANTSGEKARVIEYGYSVDHDRNLNLAAVADNKQQQQEFFELQKGRANPSAAPAEARP